MKQWLEPESTRAKIGGISRDVMVMEGIRELGSERAVSRTKHIWYSEHGTYYRFKFILEGAMSVTHVAVILCTRTGPAYEEESMKTDYPDVRNEYGMS